MCSNDPSTTAAPCRWAITIDLGAVLAAGLIAGSLMLAAAFLWGARNPDWYGYEAMYLEQGAWLADVGRDPVFTWIVRGARELFRNQGYETFRSCLLAYFLVVAVVLTFRMPSAPRLGLASGLGVAVVMFAVVFSKFTVQVREGVALSFALPAVAAVARPSRGERNRFLVPTMLVVVAALVHGGTVFVAVAVALSLLLSLGLGENVRSTAVARTLVCVGIASGIAVGAYLGSSVELTVETLGGLGIGADAEPFLSPAKVLYWVIYGVAVFVLRRQAMDGIPELADRRGAAFCVSYLSLVLPFTYALALYMVVTSQLPVATSMAARLLGTAVSLTMFLVLVRGRANAYTVLAALLAIVDQVRTILTATASS